VDIRVGDCREVLQTLDAGSVQCCVTSPPYFGLRDYGVEGQIGLEPTPDQFVAEMVAVFREVRRVLADDGTLWLNLGDSYAGIGAQWGGTKSLQAARVGPMHRGGYRNAAAMGVKAKDLYGIPWMVAFALRDDGWYLRSDIVWAKPNPMPESVTDRPTKSHEYVFLLSKSERYYYDADAIAEPAIHAGEVKRTNGNDGMDDGFDGHRTRDGFRRGVTVGETRNARSVWPIEATGNRERECLAILDSELSTADKWDAIKAMMNGAQTVVWQASQPWKGAHFATMPPSLAERCVKAGSRVGDTILDPFGGAGTTGLVAARHSRNALLIELNPQYAELARNRIHDDAPLFSPVAISAAGPL
jgi:DNA modification methylase